MTFKERIMLLAPLWVLLALLLGAAWYFGPPPMRPMIYCHAGECVLSDGARTTSFHMEKEP
jgi:hypothetical protein